MQTLYSIEVDEKIDQIRVLLTITTNNTDGSPNVSEVTTIIVKTILKCMT